MKDVFNIIYDKMPTKFDGDGKVRYVPPPSYYNTNKTPITIMQHEQKFWKHKDSKEVIDHLTYANLDQEHRADFDQCDAPAVNEQIEVIPALDEEITIPDITTNGQVDIEKVIKLDEKPMINEPAVNAPDIPTTGSPVLTDTSNLTGSKPVVDPVTSSSNDEEESFGENNLKVEEEL